MHLAILFALTSLSFATGPQIEPAPIKKLSEDSAEIGKILMDDKVYQNCTSKINKIKASFYLISIERQQLSPNKSLYTFTGNLIQGGDMHRGKLKFFVTKTTGKGFFGNPETGYECELEDAPDDLL
ncbi:MAG: hypothetical protein V4534_07870 [Myxococcota bacterium]